MEHYLSIPKSSKRYTIVGRVVQGIGFLLLLVILGLVVFSLVSEYSLQSAYYIVIIASFWLGTRLVNFGESIVRRSEVVHWKDAMVDVLLLRSFQDDNKKASDSFYIHQEFESELRRHLRTYTEFKKFVTVADPRKSMTPSGFSRALAGEDWKEAVESLSEAASLIVLLVNQSKGLEWEIEFLLNSSYLNKIIFVLLPNEDGFFEKFEGSHGGGIINLSHFISVKPFQESTSAISAYDELTPRKKDGLFAISFNPEGDSIAWKLDHKIKDNKKIVNAIAHGVSIVAKHVCVKKEAK